jgi:eukaryotic-like serine/threonine-protein kinase
VRRLQVMASVLMAGILGLTSVADAAGLTLNTSGWAQFHGSWTRSGLNTHESTLSASTISRLGILWDRDFGINDQGGPVVSNGRAFFAGWTGTLVAVRASDGHKLWSRDVGSQMIGSSPAVWESSVIVVSGTFAGSRVSAYDAATGNPRWSTAVPSEIAMSSPLLIGDRVIVAGQDGQVTCLSAATGAVRWKAFTTTMPDTGITGPMAASTSGSLIFAAGLDGTLYALRTSDGSHAWTTEVGGGIYRGGPAVSGSIVYVPSGVQTSEGGGFAIVAVSVSSGQILWKGLVGDDVHTTPAVGAGIVVVGAIDGSINALDAKTGAARWTASLGGEVWSSPAIANGLVILTTETSLFALRASNGEVLFERLLDTEGNAAMSSPAVVNGRVFIGMQYGATAWALR